MGKIDNLDLNILKIIMNNARIPSKDIAEVCGVSRAAIHQRIQRLAELGVIVGSGYRVNPRNSATAQRHISVSTSNAAPCTAPLPPNSTKSPR